MRLFLFSVLLSSVLFAEFNLPKIPQSIKNIGKKTPIDIALYAKNSSINCFLAIRVASTPYGEDFPKSKLPTIIIPPGKYYRKNISDILKGEYEFEYTWRKGAQFIDSGIKSIHIFTYHDINLPLHKRVDLTFRAEIPDSCKSF
ncbi:MAG TPA: hypothetical protein ENK74_04730 [Nitratifractor sp.]|nr:hypothetical protein [Nitratifractor sp.]